MKKLSRIVRVVMPVSLVLAIITGALLFFAPFGLPAVVKGSNGFGAFDMKFNYTPDAVMTVISHFKGDRDQVYGTYFLIDYFFLSFTSLFMLSLPLSFYLKDDKHYLLFRAAAFSSIMYCLFNVIENILISRMIAMTPLFTDGDANLSSGITTLKWVFTGIWSFAAVMLVILSLYDDSKRKKKRSSRTAVKKPE